MKTTKQIYIVCPKGCGLIRIDDGSYCEHYNTPDKNESITVVFRGPNGKVSLPWSTGAPTPKGYVREEVRGAAAVRRLERELDATDLKHHQRHVEKVARDMEPINVSIREGLRRQMRLARHPFEKDLAAAALQRMDRGYADRYDPGNHRS